MGLSDAPRSIRTNNPGALNYGPFAQRYGAVGSDGRLAIFPDVETGRRAMSGLLDTYERQHGLNTVSGIIGRWAPRGVDNNSTDQYIKTVASKLGVDPNAPLTAQHRPGLMDAMAAYEAGTSNIPRSGSFASPGGGLSGASPHMALSNAYMSQQEQPGYLDRVLNSPLFMMGASVLGAPNIGTGLMQGSQASQQAQLGGLKIAQHRDAMADRQRQRQMWEAVTQGSHPLLFGMPQELRQAISVMDPETGMKTLQNFALTNHQNAQKRSDPMYQAQLAQTQAHTKLYEAQANARESPDQVYRQREMEADRQNLTGPARTAFVLTGKMPREDQQPLTATDKKAILEADEGVQAAQNAIRGLEQALKLSKEAYSGMGAGVLGAVVDKAVPWATPGATATTQLDQVVTSQALEQLKSLFGAAPTEGERKILLDIQGSVSQSQAAREAIYGRAREAALRRLEFNKQRAAAMRNQTYYQSNGGPQPTQPDPSGNNDPLGIR